MRFLKFLVAAALASLSACSMSSGPTTPPEGKALVAGEDSSSVRVMIRTIDDGDVLWVDNYQLGTSSAVSPGPHKIGVMCEFKHSWGTKINPGEIIVDAQVGRVYELRGAPSADDKKCEVAIRMRPRPVTPTQAVFTPSATGSPI